jgi:hypothetical protein
MLIVALQFGWGVKIHADQLKEIDESRHEKNYFDIAAGIDVNGNSKKIILTEPPFIHKFEFGGDQGCWTGIHISLQVELCINCLHVLFPDQYGVFSV